MFYNIILCSIILYTIIRIILYYMKKWEPLAKAARGRVARFAYRRLAMRYHIIHCSSQQHKHNTVSSGSGGGATAAAAGSIKQIHPCGT